MFIMLLAFAPNLFAQQTDTEKMKMREDLLLKSKNQKTTGFLMLGLGAAAAVTGAILFDQNFDVMSDGGDGATNAGGVLFVAGGLSVLGSVPFFIASSNNKQKAMAISAVIGIEKTPVSGSYKQTPPLYPAIGIKWEIK